jgi:hypothetical protein
MRSCREVSEEGGGVVLWVLCSMTYSPCTYVFH